MENVWKRRLRNNDDDMTAGLKDPMYFAYVGSKESTYIGTRMQTKDNSSTKEN